MNDFAIFEIARQRHADLIAEAARSSRARSAARTRRRFRQWAAPWTWFEAPAARRPRSRGRTRAQT
jgi:hypothetical protein